MSLYFIRESIRDFIRESIRECVSKCVSGPIHKYIHELDDWAKIEGHRYLRGGSVKRKEYLRCLDKAHKPLFFGNWETRWWCPHARELRSTDPQFKNYLNDGRSENWAKICNLTGKNATWNKKCDVNKTKFLEGLNES